MSDHSEQPVIDALYRISRTVHRTDDTREALDTIIDELMRILPCDSAAIELINPDKNCLEIEVSRGFRTDLNAFALKIGMGISGWVALHGKSLNVPDVREDPRYIEVDPAVCSEMAVPIRLESGETLGAINVSSHKVAAFRNQDEKVLKLLTAEITRTLSRLWFIQQLREKADHLEVLIDIARHLAIQRDLDDILQTITSRALDIIPSSFCAIFLRDPSGHSLTLRASHDSRGSTDYEDVLSLDESSIGTAFKRNRTIEIFDLPRIEENHLQGVIEKENLASMIACPIQLEGEPIGVLNIYTNYPHRFNDSEKRIFESLASLSATAIRNAELYDRIFESEENLRRSERLTTLGLLSAEIAHEIRNSRVLSFGKSQQEIRSRSNLNKLIEDTLHLVRLKLKQSRIELAFNHNPRLSPYVEVHKG